MPPPTTVTISYTVTAQGPTSPAALAFAMQPTELILPFADLQNIGVAVPPASDVISTVLSDVTRTIMFSIIPPFIPATTVSTLGGGRFRGSVVSSSPNDTEFGTGARSLTITYNDPTGPAIPPAVPRTSLVTMKGVQPIDLVNTNHPNTFDGFISMVVSSAGSLGTNDGMISFFSGPVVGNDVSGTLVAQIIGNFQGSIVSTNDHDKVGDVGAQTVTITYFDKFGGGPFAEVVALNGTTPVNLVNLNHATITGMVVTTAGAFGANTGIITVLTALNGAGAPAGSIGPSYFQFFPQFTNDAAGNVIAADQAAPFRELYTHFFAAVLKSRVKVGPVVIA